ncbi:MAG: c-type cytochrome [Planctomycetota bacterium]
MLKRVHSRILFSAAVALSPWLAMAQETTDDKFFTQVPEIAAAAGRPAPEKTEPAKPNLFADGPAPSWIWGADQDKKYFVKKSFNGGAQFAFVKATCDDSMKLFLNGKEIASGDNWKEPVQVDIKGMLKPGENVIEAEVANAEGIAGFLAKVVLLARDGKDRYVVTDASWQAAESRDAKEWVAATVLRKLEDHPGGKFFTEGSTSSGAPRDLFNLLPGFQIERLFTVPKEKLGSWVNITSDPKGRLIVCDQGTMNKEEREKRGEWAEKGLCRITPPAIGSSEPTKVERLDVKLTGAQGLLWAFDSLYVVCNGGPGSGLYRCKDTDGDDQYDEVVKLREIPGGGEHGPHAIRLSPDGKSLYVIAGNHTKMPFEIKTNAPPQTMGGQRTEQLRATLPEGVTSRLMPNWDEDVLLPRYWDPSGHAAGVLAPGGWICQTDPDGKTWEVFSSGYRNQFDFAFNADGEMFAYDADMEYDFGAPWHRPTRVVHATSGSEFGWRSGTGKWPAYYVDSLPPVIDIGPGCPVGVEFGYGTKFPAKYQKALFICDWTFGTMYAIHMEPSGSSYKATKEEFVSRTPLPLTDCTVGADGALYFTIGGRGTQSELFRVTYVGTESTAPVEYKSAPSLADNGLTATSPNRLRQLRHEIEAYHVGEPANPHKAAAFMVFHLSNPDRFIRYAARVGLERLPVELWQDSVLNSPDVETVITGAVGLARQGETSQLPKIVAALSKIDFAKLTEAQQLELLRAYQLALIRLGSGDEATHAALGQKFDNLFPARSDFVNRELSILMIHFQSPGAVPKLVPYLTQERVASQEAIGALLERNKGYGGTVAAMLANQPDQQQYHYAFHLRTLKTGWTFEDRKTYFAWFDKARQWSGGATYPKYLNNIDNEAFSLLTDADRLKIEASGARKPYVAPELPKAKGPGREYSLDELLALSADKMKGRDFKNGLKMYGAARCIVCHRFGGDGGATGPDLTQLAGRFTLKDMTEAIVDPSKIVSDQFKATIVETKDGKSYTGKLVNDTKDSITLVIDPENATKTVEIKKDNIEEQQASTVSLMPKDLLKTLNEDEALDLLAYLMSRGNPGDPMFKK